MCLPYDESALICWLQQQLRVIEVWKTNLSMQPDCSLEVVERLDLHERWLSGELDRLSIDLEAA